MGKQNLKCSVLVDMKIIPKIGLLLCCLGLIGNGLSNLNQLNITSAADQYTAPAEHNGISNSILFSTPHPYHFLAENVHEISTEIEPENSIVASWKFNKKEFFTDELYLNRALRITLSQSVKIMIFPFHSYL